MTVVVDASAFVELLLRTDRAPGVVAAIGDEAVVVPDLVGPEVVSTLRGLERGGKVTVRRAETALRRFERAPVQTVKTGNLKRLLSMLESSRPTGWLEFSLALLDLPRSARTEVLKQWQRHMRGDRVSRSAALDTAFGEHDGNVVRGFSVLREVSEGDPRGDRVLRHYCSRMMEEHGARQWAGVVAPFRPGGDIRWSCVLHRDESPGV